MTVPIRWTSTAAPGLGSRPGGALRGGWRKDLLIVLLLSVVATTLIFWQLGGGSLSDYDEADYAQSAREMLWWSDYNTPRWNGMEFFDKPPVCYWLTAAAYRILGVNEFSARLVSACCGVLAVLMAYLLGRELFESRIIGIGACVTLLTVSRNLFSHGYNFLSLARVGMLDMPLILTMMVAVWLVWRGTRVTSRETDWYLIALGIPLGLGLMVKSIAGLIAYGIVGLYMLVGVPKRAWWRRATLKGLLVSLLIAAPWHLGQLLVWGRHFWESYMVSLTLGYVTGEQGHTRDYLFYLRSIQRGFPVLYPLVAVAAFYSLCRAAKCLLHRTERTKQDRAVILLLCWVVVPFALYNVSRSRIGWYMIPIYPPLALLSVHLLLGALRRLLALILPLSRWRWSGAVATLAVLVATSFSNPRLPRVSNFNPDVKSVARFGNDAVPKGAVLINYWPGSYWIRPSALFYADRPFLLVTDARALESVLKTPGDYYVLTDWRDWEAVQELGVVAYRSGDYALIKGSRLAAGKSDG